MNRALELAGVSTSILASALHTRLARSNEKHGQTTRADRHLRKAMRAEAQAGERFFGNQSGMGQRFAAVRKGIK